MTTQVSERADWYAMEAADAALTLEVDPDLGLNASEVEKRVAKYGKNRLAEGEKESGFRAFLRQYEDFMQIVLLVAAVVNQLVTGDTPTTVLLAGLTVFNAVIGLRQEAKAEESVAALASMMKTIARVRRDGQVLEVDAAELVPGDVVLVEAGNLVPADGRITVAATLEIEEAALTGESLPVSKDIAPVTGADVPLGDRTCMAYMNTSVTRGRGEMVITATGMETEIGHIAGMLASTESEKTPLQKQLDALSKIIAVHRCGGPGRGGVVGAGPGPDLRHPVHHRGGPGSCRHPDRASRGGDRAVVDRHPGDRPAPCNRETSSRGGDPRARLRRSAPTRRGR